jgi:exonuclease SbcC
LPVTQPVRDLLDRYLAQWQQVPVQWLLWAAVGAGVLFLLFWLRAAGRRSLARRLRAEAAKLGETLRQARELEFDIQEAAPGADEVPAETVSYGENDDKVSDADPEVDAMETSAEPVRPDAMQLEDLLGQIESGQATVRQVREYVEPEQAWLGYVGGLLEDQVGALDAAIENEESRLRERDNLLQVRAGIRDKRDEIQARIDLRNKALELLHGAIGHLSNNFNRDIKELVARLLPRFTDGRYEHLQIDSDLNVRVFSAEKRDFMDLEEVSSGTQRQIMLALRLALSQKLLSRKIRGRQFAFLDEPFAFFDEERTRNALIALTELGDDISQVWIVAQSFPRDAVNFDAHIQCERGRDELTL